MQPQNVFLKFFLAAAIFLGTAFAQFILHSIEAYSGAGTPMNQFVDLCTLANVSVLIFDEHLRGYYLHAKAPW